MKRGTTTTADVLRDGERELRRAARRFSWTGNEADEVMTLIYHVLGHVPEADEIIPTKRLERIRGLIARRAQGEPMPYILGHTDFLGMRLHVKPGGFVPRETTEHLAREAIARVRRRRAAIAVDVATGIGPVALAVAHAVPRASVFGLDISSEALTQARANARRLGVQNARFLRSDMLAALPREVAGRVDVITSHPPYVAKWMVRELPAELKKFEPVVSLTDESEDGLGFARELLVRAHSYLRPGGWMLMEVGSYLARDLRSAYVRAGYTEVRSTYGEWKLTRVIAGRL